MNNYEIESIGWQIVIAIALILIATLSITAVYQGQVTERNYASLGYHQQQAIGSYGYIWTK